MVTKWARLAPLFVALLLLQSAPVLGATRVFLPLVSSESVDGTAGTHRVNAPFFEGKVRYAETAVFWFGEVTPTANYADVRVGYNTDELYLSLEVFDRLLWYDTATNLGDPADWDSASLFLDTEGRSGQTLGPSSYRFDTVLQREDAVKVYRGNSAGWSAVNFPLTAVTGWRGNRLNDSGDDRGWALTLTIPFQSLGLPGPPAEGTIWGIAWVLHDRDDAIGTPIADQIWPPALDAVRTATWGQMGFGLPTYSAPAASPEGITTIRHRLDGVVVADAAVGGTTGNLCPGDSYFIWNEWGRANFAGAPDFNVQNQSDVADWPCFSKYYVEFPLDSVPEDAAIISATLTLHQYGGADPAQALPSWMQVLTVDSAWSEATLTWNNAPLANENYGGTWVSPVSTWPGWPGVPWRWDVGGAVAKAYAAGHPLRLAVYSADSAYHSGKYFVSSDAGDWNAQGRPTLEVVWGNRSGAEGPQLGWRAY